MTVSVTETLFRGGPYNGP